jgi:hypothetical protein
MRALLAVFALALGVGRGERGEGRDGAHRNHGWRSSVPLPAPRSPSFHVIVLPGELRAAMSAVWVANNRHWDELADQNTLTQLLGTGKPTQLEYLGCLVGDVVGDTLFVRRLAPAAELRQLQFAVAGSCDAVAGAVGTWHTHPYRADAGGRALKERGLSAMDLRTFAAARDVVTMVMWDRDSIDAAAKTTEGTVRHPAPLVVP